MIDIIILSVIQQGTGYITSFCSLILSKLDGTPPCLTQSWCFLLTCHKLMIYLKRQENYVCIVRNPHGPFVLGLFFEIFLIKALRLHYGINFLERFQRRKLSFIVFLFPYKRQFIVRIDIESLRFLNNYKGTLLAFDTAMEQIMFSFLIA